MKVTNTGQSERESTRARDHACLRGMGGYKSLLARYDFRSLTTSNRIHPPKKTIDRIQNVELQVGSLS